MSEDSIKNILSRAVLEEEFRKILLADPTKALAGYELAEEEKAIFQNLSPEEFEGLLTKLDERISRGIFDGPFTKWAKCLSSDCDGPPTWAKTCDFCDNV